MDLPRYFGTPSQVYLTNPIALQNFIKLFNGKRPCFISCFRFPTPQQPIVDCAVFDIDSKNSLNKAYIDTKKLKTFCDKHDIPYIINFSGSKGFHFFLFFEPENGTIQTKDKLYSLQLAMIECLQLKYVDLPTIGRLRFLIRIPTTKYIRREIKTNKTIYTSNNYYCRNLSPSDFDKGIKHILTISKKPGKLPTKPKPSHHIDDIIMLLPNYKLIHRNGNDFFEALDNESTTIPSLDAIGLPCLKKACQKPNPTHRERLELVAWLKLLGYNNTSIIKFIETLNWADYNYKITAANVACIKPRFPTCKLLRELYPEECKNCNFHNYHARV